MFEEASAKRIYYLLLITKNDASDTCAAQVNSRTVIRFFTTSLTWLL